MALVVEDGTIVADANTYINRAAIIAYAADRGVTLANDATTDTKIVKAMDYLALYDQQWKGEQVEYGVQTLAWPRKYVYIGTATTVFPDDEIPGQLVRAQAELVLQVNNGVNLLPTLSGDTAFVKREKVDVIETEYSEAMALKLAGLQPDMPLVDALLEPLFATASRLRTVRI
jgi:hypothetical protein